MGSNVTETEEGNMRFVGVGGGNQADGVIAEAEGGPGPDAVTPSNIPPSGAGPAPGVSPVPLPVLRLSEGRATGFGAGADAPQKSKSASVKISSAPPRSQLFLAISFGAVMFVPPLRSMLMFGSRFMFMSIPAFNSLIPEVR